MKIDSFVNYLFPWYVCVCGVRAAVSDSFYVYIFRLVFEYLKCWLYESIPIYIRLGMKSEFEFQIHTVRQHERIRTRTSNTRLPHGSTVFASAIQLANGIISIFFLLAQKVKLAITISKYNLLF